MCKHRAVSLSLSLYFYDLLSKFARRSSDVPDQGQTCIPRVIIYSDFAFDDHHTLKGTFFRQVPSLRYMPWADPEWGQGIRTPLKNHKNIGFPSNIDPDPATKPAFNGGPFRQWRFADGPMVVHFLWHFGPLSLPPLTKCSGSAHTCSACESARLKLNCRRT